MSDFYCDIKKCRKTWRDTPEYLTLEDWSFLEALRTTRNFEEFNEMMHEAYAVSLRFIRNDIKRKDLPTENEEQTYDWARWFFNRVIGWPEGYGYYFGQSIVAQRYYYPNLVKNITS